MTLWEEQLTGIFPPIMTPFSSPVGPVMYDKLSANIARYNETDLRGYMPLGSNGEFRSLNDDESLQILRTISDAKTSDKTLIAGAGRESAYSTIEFIKRAADIGIDFASLLPPHYFAGDMNAETLVSYYSAVADVSPVPIMIYNIPKFASSVVIPPDVITTMAPHPNIAGMKDSSKEDITVYLNAVPPGAEFHILAGSVSKYYQAMMHGCVGGVLSMANYLPEMTCNLHRLAVNGNSRDGEVLDSEVRELSAQAAGNYGPAGVKAAMDLLGLYGGPPRNPLPGCTDEEIDQIRRALTKAGVL